jgi:hypothetical protein
MKVNEMIKAIQKSNTRRVSPETQALLQILELGNNDIANGNLKPAADVITRLRNQAKSPSRQR